MTKNKRKLFCVQKKYFLFEYAKRDMLFAFVSFQLGNSGLSFMASTFADNVITRQRKVH